MLRTVLVIWAIVATAVVALLLLAGAAAYHLF